MSRSYSFEKIKQEMLGRGNKVLSIQVDNLGESVGIMYGSRSVYDMKDKVK